LAYRKLEQKVQAFKQQVNRVAELLDIDHGADRERVAAMVVGRFQNGTPIALAARNSLRSTPNNFTYADDKDGLKCPLFAHIRKVNPRTEASRAHRIVRRGIPYGNGPVGEQAPEPEVDTGVGLLFMCFQSSIEDQFE